MTEELAHYHHRYGKHIKEIENNLVRYWKAKQNDLELHEIVNVFSNKFEHSDIGVGTPTI